MRSRFSDHFEFEPFSLIPAGMLSWQTTAQHADLLFSWYQYPARCDGDHTKEANICPGTRAWTAAKKSYCPVRRPRFKGDQLE